MKQGLADNIIDTGSRSLHIQKHTCSNCGYPSAGIRRCTSLSTTFCSILDSAHYSTPMQHAPCNNDTPPPFRTELLSLGRNNIKLTTIHRQLGREGKAQKDHRQRKNEDTQARRPQVQERFPVWRAKGCPWSLHFILIDGHSR